MSGGNSAARTRRLLVAGTAASVVCWFLPGAIAILYPIRLLVTIIHEAAHGLATVLTGGAVAQMVILPSGNGMTLSEGGMRLAVIPAGYLGTILLGALLLVNSGPGRGKYTLAALALILGAVTLGWLRDGFSLTVGVGLVLVLLFLRRSLRGAAADFVASFLAVQLCLNALTDVRTLIWLSANGHTQNDAATMASTFGLVPWFWAMLWAMLSVVIMVAAFRHAWSGQRP